MDIFERELAGEVIAPQTDSEFDTFLAVQRQSDALTHKLNTLPYLGDEMKPFFAAITAIILLITAAAAIVPCRMPTKSGCEAKVAQAIPVKTRETHIIITYFPQDAEYRYAVKADRKNMDLVWMP